MLATVEWLLANRGTMKIRTAARGPGSGATRNGYCLSDADFAA